MKVGVTCSSCGTALLLDEAFAGTALPCPSCASADGLRVPAARLPERPAPKPVRRPAAIKPAAVEPIAVKTAAPVGDEEVVCPRCNLHFVPRRPGGETRDSASSERAAVLVVEDMAFFREVAAEALAERFAVRTAATLAEARSALEAGGIDLVVLDLTLDGGEFGIDLLHDLRSSGIPVLIYTAQDESDMYGERWDDLRRLGASDVVVKGIHVGELLVRKASALLGHSVEDLEPR